MENGIPQSWFFQYSKIISYSHWLTFSNSTFKLVSRFRMLGLLRNKFVSSAKRFDSKILEHLGISFMYV